MLGDGDGANTKLVHKKILRVVLAAAFDRGGYLYHGRVKALADAAREAGLNAQGFKGMEYNPFTKRYWLSQNTSVNYLLACRKA